MHNWLLLWNFFQIEAPSGAAGLLARKTIIDPLLKTSNDDNDIGGNGGTVILLILLILLYCCALERIDELIEDMLIQFITEFEDFKIV